MQFSTGLSVVKSAPHEQDIMSSLSGQGSF